MTDRKESGRAGVPEPSERMMRLRGHALRIGFGALGTMAVLAVLLVLVFPTRQYRDQRDRIDDSRVTLAALRAETTALQEQVQSMGDPVVVERLAREQLSLLQPGDELYRLSIDPRDALDLPANWPLPGLRVLLTGE
jgi:cell division protein FtsB